MLLLLLYGGIPEDGLNLLRFRLFATKVMLSTTCVQVNIIPHTTAAAVYHSYRVHLQTQTWIDNNCLDPSDWGWEIANSMLMTFKTDLPAAPKKNFLKVIRCNCKRNCDSCRCSCRKRSLQCSVGCGDFRVITCTHSPTLADVDMDDSE